ncbi:MAG: hypothetical protein M1825_001796 [Sarcosagium campestre]|nr:MAG: hypothetical protein M1825_001796 [Sarcosagium campestre]
MFPPSQGLNLDITALSGICGSVSIACWIVVFSPQIIENFRRGSADGLSIVFLVIWLAGDVFNILGAVLQGVLPTMVILALYYTLADIVLLAQCFYYRGFTLRDLPSTTKEPNSAAAAAAANSDEHEPLLNGSSVPTQRRTSSTPGGVSSSHLSPVNPLHDRPSSSSSSDPPASTSTVATPPQTALQTALFNTTAVLVVCTAGVLGWYISRASSDHNRNRRTGHGSHHRQRPDTTEPSSSPLPFSMAGQLFGYLCAALYLGSRVPQLLLNFRRQSTEGVSMLFFLFACIGNLTYVLSIFAFEPPCQRRRSDDGYGCSPGQAAQQYGRYIAVNASWILGSFGTLLLDIGIFLQFFWYRGKQERLSHGDGGSDVVAED